MTSGINFNNECKYCHGEKSGTLIFSGGEVYHPECVAFNNSSITMVVSSDGSRADGLLSAGAITDDVRRQVLRDLLGDRPIGSYFVLGAGFQLMDVTTMVDNSIRVEQEREKLLTHQTALLIECREWIATLRARWSPPKDRMEYQRLTWIIEAIGELLGAEAKRPSRESGS
jgi:hypothetical protein